MDLKKDEFPRPRSGSVLFANRNQLMVWGGMTQVILGEGDGRFLVSIDLPDVEGPVLEVLDLITYEWRRQITFGDIPEMGKSSYHTVIDNTLYMFGGCTTVYCNSLYKLDLITFNWSKLNTLRSPPSMCEGGMVHYGRTLIIFGGKGKPLMTNLQHNTTSNDSTPNGATITTRFGATFNPNFSFGYTFDDGWNNVMYEYDIISDKWQEIGREGDRPPPCSRFSFNKIDRQRALLFGGKQDKYKTTYKDVYILDLETKHWKRYSPDISTNKRWPCSRGFHVGSCLIDPESDEAENEQYVAVFWGQGEDAKHVPDIWILHVQKMEWKELQLPSSYKLRPRMFHMSCSYHIQTKQTDVIVYGGNKQRKDKFDRNVMTDAVIFRFGSVQRLDEQCIRCIKTHIEYLKPLIHLLPMTLRQDIEAQEDNNVIRSVQRLYEQCIQCIKTHIEYLKPLIHLLPMTLRQDIEAQEDNNVTLIYPLESYFV